MNFIEKVAKHIHSNNLALKNLTIILPSERARKYLKAALFKIYEKPIISPKIITMDQWVKSYSNEAVIDKTRALIKLYEIQLQHAQTEIDQSFDDFLAWGNILLSDFNEIDRYMLDANQVFKNLADIKEIESWSFGDEEKITETQRRFMEFWDRLPIYYGELKKNLSSTNTCYGGSAFKFLANNIDVLFKDDKEHRFLFAGFNALSKAELSIVKDLEQMGRADILIDVDDYYYLNKNHEAGSFIRELSTSLDGKNLEFRTDELRQKKLKIDIVECAQKTGQVKVASSILESSTKEQIDTTLLLLADESLIGSILKNLPKKIGKANITLGLPVRNTSVRTWVELLFAMQENRHRFRTNAIYFNDLQSFWNHPFLIAILSEEEKALLMKTEHDVIKFNRIFLKREALNLGALTKNILNLVSEDWKFDWNFAIRQIRELNRIIYKELGDEFAFEKAILECFDHSLIDFENIVAEGLPSMSLNSFKHLFNQHWGSKSIAYHGNPMDGLQIMGLLETRGLDFKRIICVGMNEGQLPPTNPIQTLIPMDLRRYLGLPTPREKQGIFAHHFYRLLHSCEEFYVTYCTADESIGSNEPSRYLMQLEMELSRINRNVVITKKIYTLESERESNLREIAKTAEIMSRMDDLLEKSASASMFKKYITCPLDFYFRYIMEFGEAETVEEEIENSTFGTFIHNTLEELYADFARYDAEGNLKEPTPTNLTSFDVESMLKRFKIVLHQQFMNHFNGDKDSFMKGKNLLSYNMAIELTERFLKSEIAFLSKQKELVFIESLEQPYNYTLEVEVGGIIKKVNVRGIIDRIDRIGDKVRIIDYKSGKVHKDEVKFRDKDIDEDLIYESIVAKKHILQLIQYGYLYYKIHGIVPESSIISFVSGNNELFTLGAKKIDVAEVTQHYPYYLGRIINEMYDESVPFQHNSAEHFSYCQYCD